MAMHYREGVGPFTLDSDPRWRWMAYGYAVDGAFWPYRMELRFKAGPCEHDTAPEGAVTWDNIAEQPDGGYQIWEPRPCDCWDGLDVPPARADLPPGGLSSRQLREVRLGLAEAKVHEMARNVERWDMWLRDGDPNAPAYNSEVRKVLDAADTPAPFTQRGRGRPATGADVHIRRLSVLADVYGSGGKQSTAAKRLRVGVATLRHSVAWGREHGLWQQTGRGSRGGLTEQGRAAVAALPTTKGGKR